MEAAEHELLRAHGLTVKVRNAEQMMSWPRVSARCEFRSVVRFEDVLDIDVKITRMGEKSISYQYDFSHEGRAVADGEITVVCCQMSEAGPPQSIPVPSWFIERLQAEARGVIFASFSFSPRTTEDRCSFESNAADDLSRPNDAIAGRRAWCITRRVA